MELKYSLKRSEIWRWYWNSWWKGSLKWVHLYVLVIVVIGFLYFDHKYGAISAQTFIKSILVYLGAFFFMVLYPQIMYKPQMRTLAINENGICTKIAKFDKVISWDEVLLVENSDGYIRIVGKNKYAMLVPERAFSCMEKMQEFYQYAHARVSEPKNA